MSNQPGTSASPGISRGTAWQNYGLSILFVILIPLLPMIIEWLAKGSLDEKALLITTSILGASIAIASNNRLIFGVGMIIAILEAALYGIVFGGAIASVTGSGKVATMTAWIVLITGEQSDLLKFAPWTLIMILVLITLTALERFRRHVQDREEFLEFMKGKTHP